LLSNVSGVPKRIRHVEHTFEAILTFKPEFTFRTQNPAYRPPTEGAHPRSAGRVKPMARFPDQPTRAEAGAAKAFQGVSLRRRLVDSLLKDL
jgi:hypothetical protein